MYDTIISGGTLVDGTGGPPRSCDVAVVRGKIAAIGRGLGVGRESIDARGLVVTPGFVDVHTHFDAQVTWDHRLEPAVWHGITTVVMGNCGVGFAPVRPEARDFAVQMMDSVEDIPSDVVDSAMVWNWEHFPEYLASIGRTPRTIDVAAMIPHANLRVYVMGPERATQTPSAVEIRAMADLTREAVRAGAVGVSTSRTILHTTKDGTVLPGTFASEQELIALAAAAREGGEGVRGLLEVVPAGCAFPEPTGYVDDVDLLIRVARRSDCPIVFSLLQSNHAPEEFLTILDRVDSARAEGVNIYPEVGTRPISTLLTLMGRSNPFYSLPSYAPLRDLSLERRYAALQDPELRTRLVREENPNRVGLELLFSAPDFWRRTFPLRTPQDYYTEQHSTVQAIADRTGISPKAVALDLLMEREGRGILMHATCNWARASRDDLHTMVVHPSSILGLGDGGAHISATVDVSQPTSFLADWVRDRGPGNRHGIALAAAVRKLTRDNAMCFGLTDRGVLAEGMKADVNVINLDELDVEMPTMVYDLPLGVGRLDQRARGYVATLVNGEVIQRGGNLTGRRPGRVWAGLH
jgi:N-acyl-D-amino-acid deacylase